MELKITTDWALYWGTEFGTDENGICEVLADNNFRYDLIRFALDSMGVEKDYIEYNDLPGYEGKELLGFAFKLEDVKEHCPEFYKANKK